MTRYADRREGGPAGAVDERPHRGRGTARPGLGSTCLIAAALFLALIMTGAATPAAAQTTTFLDAPVADADTDSGAPFLNQGTFDEVHMGRVLTSNKHTFIRWDLSAIPDSATVLNATIRVYAFDHGTFDVNTSFSLVLGAWGELTINWSNEPALAPPAYEYPQDTSEAGIGWHEYEVTTLAQSWVRGPNYGMAAHNDSEDEQISWATREDEFARYPELTVVWELPPYRAPDLFPLGAALAVIAVSVGFFVVISRRERTFEEVLVLLILVIVMIVALGAWLATR